MTRTDELGAFLRSRRGRVAPQLIGVDPGPRRRVPGLRREELAQAVHVSVDYLVRLEQGRVGRPSPDIVEALARALLLDDAERRHLFRLAGASEPASAGGDGTAVRPGVGLLVRTLDPSPVVLLSRRLDLLAWNPTADVLLGPFRGERNYARLVFGDPATRTLHADWDEAARQTVALLHQAAARHPDDRELQALVAELRAGDPRVDRWWDAHDVAEKSHGLKRYVHPLVGELTLHYEALVLADDGDQILTIYAADPDSPDGQRLARLAHVARARAVSAVPDPVTASFKSPSRTA
jgi:transcriptional regulator with XRE-family HTH domain